MPFLRSSNSGSNPGFGPSSGHGSDYGSDPGSVPESDPAEAQVKIDFSQKLFLHVLFAFSTTTCRD